MPHWNTRLLRQGEEERYCATLDTSRGAAYLVWWLQVPHAQLGADLCSDGLGLLNQIRSRPSESAHNYCKRSNFLTQIPSLAESPIEGRLLRLETGHCRGASDDAVMDVAELEIDPSALDITQRPGF